jgi:hypothetical protein
MNKFRTFAALLSAVTLASCVGEKSQVQDITGPLPDAAVKFFNFGPGAPGVNFYANTTKMSAISSTTGTESTTGVAYGGAASGGFYSAINAGDYTLTGKIAATTDKDLTIASVTTPIVAGKRYSFYISGIYNTTTKTSDAFVVEDDFSNTIDYANATVRFVGASPNAAAQTLYARLVSSGVETAVGAAVAYKAGGTFVTLPPGVYDLSTRNTGSATNVITRAAVSFVAGRVYTITSRGDITLTTGTNARALDFTANR